MTTESSQATGKSNVRRQRWMGVMVLVLVPVIVAQVWIVSAGRWWPWPVYTNQYSCLADGFLHGQLSLRAKPPPELLALPDPYDPGANGRYRLQDAVLYQGKYYIYWGPAPAVLTAGACLLAGIREQNFGDQYLAGGFLVGMVGMAGILIFQVRARLFPEQPRMTAAMAVWSLGLGTPVLYTLGRAAIYETAIAGGQFFLMAGFCAAWRALDLGRSRWLWGAGVCWGLSLASRLSLAPAVGMVALITILWWRRSGHSRAWGSAIALAAPLTAAGVLLAWYNWARFGSITEFGMQYQLAGRNQHAMWRSEFTSLRYVLPNVVSYLAATPFRIQDFPYLLALQRRSGLAGMFHMGKNFGFEPLVGVLISQPFLLLGPLAWGKWAGKGLEERPAEESLLGWLRLSLIVAALAGIAPALVIEYSTMRYLLDAVPCLTVLAALGYWRLPRWMPRPAAAWAHVDVAVIVGAQCVLGLLLAITGYYGHFVVFNRPLYDAMQSFFGRW